MKKRVVKSFAFALSGLMIMSSVTPTFAYDLDSNNNSIESVEYQNTNDADYSNQTNVFAELSSEYKVTIPKTIVLSGVTKKADYYVKVEGDIAGYEKVHVTPDDIVNLYTKNKDMQTGIISQDKLVWKFNDFNVNANGTVEAPGLTAGKWSGTFDFHIYLDGHEELVLGDLVLPPVEFDTTSPAQTSANETVNFKVGESGNIDITYNNQNVALASTVTSSDENVVKVDKNKLTAVGEGTSTITVDYDTAKSGIDNGVKSYSFNVKVIKDVADKSLTVDTEDLTMGAGTSHEVHAFYGGEDVTDEVNWSSNNSKITVKNGLVVTSATAQVGDTATITASTDDTSTLVATLDKLGLITVASAEDGSDSVSFTVTIVDINFDDSDGNEIDNVSILPGENKSIRAKIVPETTGTVVWSCTASSGVTLQKKGNDVIIYIADDMPEGRVYNVIATYGDYSKTIELTIASAAKDNLSVSIEDGNTLTVGDVKDINVTTTDGSTPSNVTITSSDENVAKIVDGKVEAVGAGEATITISADGSIAKTIDIVVEEPKLALSDMSFSQIQTIAKEGKAADYGIEVGDTIKINDTMEAAVVEIGEDYIEFCTVKSINAISGYDKKCTFNSGWIGVHSLNSFYTEPLVNNGKTNSARVCYVGSNIQTQVEAWLDKQSEEFKASLLDVEHEYPYTTLTYDPSTKTYKQPYNNSANPAPTVKNIAKVYIPNDIQVSQKINAIVPNLGAYWLPQLWGCNSKSDACAFGQLNIGTSLTTGDSYYTKTIVMFRIG